MEQELTILTPEKVELTYRIAGIPSRITAFLIDLIILTVANLVLWLLLGLVVTWLGLPADVAVMMVTVGGYASAVSFFLYHILFPIFLHGRTPGKLLGGMRVMMTDGRPITAAAAVVRGLLLLIDFFPSLFLLGVVTIFLSQRSQRVGDMVAGTIVILSARQRLPVGTARPSVPRVHPLEPHVGRVDRLTEADLRAIRTFLERYPELAPDTRSRLYQEIWDSLVSRVEFEVPAGATPLAMMQAIASKLERSLERRG